jgi:hypothetical protein
MGTSLDTKARATWAHREKHGKAHRPHAAAVACLRHAVAIARLRANHNFSRAQPV